MCKKKGSSAGVLHITNIKMNTKAGRKTQNKAGHLRVTAFYTCCHSNRCNMADCAFLDISTWVSSGHSYSLLCNRAHTVATWALPAVLTLVASSVLDDDGASAARLLLGLGHALASFVVRVISGVDSHLLLNHSQTWQLLGSSEMKRKPSAGSFRVIFSS